jgi:hypothetical protein
MVMNIGFGLLGGHSGSAPSPFDALNGPRLAGAEGSHPLHSVAAEELLRPTDGALAGEIALDHPARVGDGITGHIKFTATRAISSRKAYLRLVGLRLDEVRRSEEHRNSKGEVTYTERWVETSGNLFSHDAFLEPPIPTNLAAGETWESSFAVPAPQLGPPSAHLGESIIAGPWRSAGTSPWVPTISWPSSCRSLSTPISCAPVSASRAAPASWLGSR